MQEVVAHEDSSLQQQEGEADAVPNDTSLIAGKIAVLINCKNAHRKVQPSTIMSFNPYDQAIREAETSDCSVISLPTCFLMLAD